MFLNKILFEFNLKVNDNNYYCVDDYIDDYINYYIDCYIDDYIDYYMDQNIDYYHHFHLQDIELNDYGYFY